MFALVLFSGCNDPNDPAPEETHYMNFKQPELLMPAKCNGSEFDTCEVYDCLVDLCWCEESPNATLLQGAGDYIIKSEQDAEERVVTALYEYKALNPEFSIGAIKNTIKLNNIFYNVFVETDEEETVYTVSVDGMVFKTYCGV